MARNVKGHSRLMRDVANEYRKKVFTAEYAEGRRGNGNFNSSMNDDEMTERPEPSLDWEAFGKFVDTVTNKSRFIVEVSVNGSLQYLSSTAVARIETLGKGTAIYRAQIAQSFKPKYTCDGGVEPEYRVGSQYAPAGRTRMLPITEGCREGRANPKGISYFYRAATAETAITEVRPSLDDLVTVATFSTKRQLRLVNCTSGDHGKDIGKLKFFGCTGTRLTPEKVERIVWHDINIAFSKPVNRSDDSTEYVPTQVLAEYFRHQGYDGVLYSSSLDQEGVNVVLFNPRDVSLQKNSLQLRRVTRIDIVSTEVSDDE